MKTPMIALFLIAFQQILLGSEAYTKVPALYIFGDSQADCGNENLIDDNEDKSMYDPYGKNFPYGPTGRYSDGDLITDQIGYYLDVQASTPFVHDEVKFKANKRDGYNFAFASAGILDETGSTIIELFKNSISEYLNRTFHNSSTALSENLSESLFVVLVGSNDYVFNYLDPLQNSTKHYTPKRLARVLASRLANFLEELYTLGGRKFFMFEVGPLGCYPLVIDMVRPESVCAKDINEMVQYFNTQLGDAVAQLNYRFQDATFYLIQIYDFLFKLVQHPVKYGLREIRVPCCPTTTTKNSMGLCAAHGVPCSSSKLHMFWDKYHLGSHINKLIAEKACKDSGFCRRPADFDFLSATSLLRPRYIEGTKRISKPFRRGLNFYCM
ncbi:GDSL lipase/esterase [Dillenia turbinata]|uniref:GDSL lipase/esterase n=1 Tax=Dillenia turbinata TaxID=194707 RepID=A0AAN8VIB3_9MAGN